MNRRQKIIVSVVGIFIVLLALVGLTYAYFLTQVKGNTNNKSISVTTANLRLVYGGDDGSIIGDNEIIEPDTTFAPKTFTVTNEGNETIDSYAVVIENFGVYYNEDSTIINENNVEVPVYANDVTKLSRPEDFEIVITCKNQDNEDCTGYSGALPTESAIMLTNSIEVDETQTYTATLTYKEAGTNQSADMNKRIEGKFNIIGLSDTVDLTGTVTSYQKGDYVQTNSTKRVSAINPDGTYKVLGLEAGTHKIKVCAADPEHPEVKDCADEDAKLIQEINIVKGETASGNNSTKTITITEDSRVATVNVNVTNSSVTIEEEVKEMEKGTLLVDAIINRAKSITESDSKTSGYAMYSETLRTTPAKEISAADESLLLTTEDDYTETTGNPSYYFRGNVEDNYVTFSNKCWRIVRIQGDGSIKLTLESQSRCSEDMTSDFSIGRTNWGYKTENSKYIGDYKSSTSGMKNLLTTWLNVTDDSGVRTNITESAEKWLKTEEWCLGNTTSTYAYSSPYALLGTTATENYTSGIEFYYETGRNLYGNGVTRNATLKCNGETDSSKIGALTADEVVYAGGKAGSANTNYYLYKGQYWWTLSRSYFGGTYDSAFHVYGNGDLNDSYSCVVYDDGVRPAVSLNTGVKIISGGEGTLKNPYIINEG